MAKKSTPATKKVATTPKKPNTSRTKKVVETASETAKEVVKKPILSPPKKTAPKKIVASVSESSASNVPSMSNAKNPDFKGYIPKAITGGYDKNSFIQMTQKHFEGHNVRVDFVNNRQCKVYVNNMVVTRVVNGETVEGVFVGNNRD